jgi:broad specificity phosphatase PhoE
MENRGSVENGKTRIILIRHTNTGFHGVYFLGMSDVPITKEGIVHAKRISELLKDTRIDKIYSSCLRRSVMTAEEIAKPHNLDVHHKIEFNEINFGVIDGLTGEEAEKQYPGLIEKRNKDRIHFKPPGGESIIEARDRSIPAFRELFETYNGKTIIVVIHGVLMRLIYKEVTGRDIYKDDGKYMGFGCRMHYEKDGNEDIKFIKIENDVPSESKRD